MKPTSTNPWYRPATVELANIDMVPGSVKGRSRIAVKMGEDHFVLVYRFIRDQTNPKVGEALFTLHHIHTGGTDRDQLSIQCRLHDAYERGELYLSRDV